MKTGWQKRSRKERLEIIAADGTLLCPAQAALAWRRLLGAMIEMSGPEHPRTPRFEDLLNAITSGIVHGRKLNMKISLASSSQVCEKSPHDGFAARYQPPL